MLILKGFLIGICKIIPGVSGGMVAISLGLYDKGVKAISKFFKDPRKNALFLIQIGIGLILGLLVFSKIIDFFLTKYYLPTMLLFLGLILGGLPSLFKKVAKTSKKNYIITFIALLLVLCLGFVKKTNEISEMTILTSIVVGSLETAATVVPGLSGSALLMLFGLYKPFIALLSNLTDFNYLVSHLGVVIPFGLSLIVSALLLVKLMDYLLEKHESKTYYAIIGLMLGSIILVFKETLASSFSPLEVIIGLGLGVGGYFLAGRLK